MKAPGRAPAFRCEMQDLYAIDDVYRAVKFWLTKARHT